MDPFQALMGTEILEEDKQKMLSQMLRGKAASGAGLATSGLREVADQGRLMQTSAQQDAQNIGLQQARAKQEEGRRLDDMLRASTAAAGSGFSKVSGGRADKLYEEVERAGTVLSLAKGLPNAGNEGGMYGAGTVKNWLATNAPLLATEDMEDKADMWRNWNMEYNNITRHGLFGSALTATEKAAWRAASINENMTPEQIAKNMTVLEKITQGKAAKRAIALMNEKRDPQWIYDNYVDILPDDFWADPRGWRDQNKQILESFTSNVSVQDLSDEDIERLIAEQEGR
jgi:hypothetical protein